MDAPSETHLPMIRPSTAGNPYRAQSCGSAMRPAVALYRTGAQPHQRPYGKARSFLLFHLLIGLALCRQSL